MSFGRLLGEGRTAEVYEHGQGRAIKLLRPGLDPNLLRREADMTELAASAGAPAPTVHQLSRVDDRPGMVVDRLSGKSLLDHIATQFERAEEWATLLARTHAKILSQEVTTSDVRERLRARVMAERALSDRQRLEVLTSIDSLPGGNKLLHGDFHPQNVFVDGDAVTVIDWVDAAAGLPAADIARTLLLMSPMAIPAELSDRDAIAKHFEEFVEAYVEAVLALTETSRDEVDRWSLPFTAARLGEGIEGERETLLRRIEVETRTE